MESPLPMVFACDVSSASFDLKRCNTQSNGTFLVILNTFIKYTKGLMTP
jgi:hypothetical protein